MSRIRWKLLAAMIVVVAVAVGLSGIGTRSVTHRQVRELLVTAGPRGDSLARTLEQQYRGQGWAGVEAALARLTAGTHDQAVVATPAGAVVAVSSALRDADVRLQADGRLSIVRRTPGGLVRIAAWLPGTALRDGGGHTIGFAYALVPDPAASLELRLGTLDRHLAWAFGGAAAVAILLALVVARRITSPLERLTVAAETMARGGQPARVAVKGQDEVAQLGRAFNAMADALAAQQELRRRMTTDVAHELRTPLTILRCELEAIEDGLAAPDSERIHSLHEEVLHLGRLVDDLQELALADAGALTMQREELDLAAAVERIVALHRSAAASIDLDAAAGLRVSADPLRLAQVLRNLLGNAIRHSPPGTAIQVGVRREGEEAVIAVSDGGPGIPPAELERVFERFYRLEESRSRQAGGAGLGLAIVRRLVELHGGRTWATSAGGDGATFLFTLPLLDPEAGLHEPFTTHR